MDLQLEGKKAIMAEGSLRDGFREKNGSRSSRSSITSAAHSNGRRSKLIGRR